MATTFTEGLTGRELRFLADNYEQAQTLRKSIGERIRAVVQGRDVTFIPIGFVDEDGWVSPDGELLDGDATLKLVAKGEFLGPVPLLGRSYRRYLEEEKDTRKEMMYALEVHPAWHWLKRVRGIGPTLGCKLLARLDPEKAPYPSSFWKYCGLGTVPGVQYKCDVCGLTVGYPDSYNIKPEHKAVGTQSKCPGALVRDQGPEDGVRVAQPKLAGKGERRSYDAYAKKVMYLVATQFLKSRGPYEEFYRSERAKAELERPGWPDARKHYLALRKTQKLFLSHLHEVWRGELGLETPDAYAIAHLGHEGRIDPWDMVEEEKE